MGALRDIATQLWREASEKERAEITLPGGLRVVCKVEGTTRKLGLCRPGARVPFDERVIACLHFGVPSKIWPEEITMGKQLWACYTWQTQPAEQLQLWGE